MSFTYNLESDDVNGVLISKVRQYIPDKDEENALFTDAEISSYLEDNDGIARLAAAEAIETIAGDEAMVQKVQETLGLKTDGAKLLQALLQRAQRLIDRHSKAVEEAEAAAAELENDVEVLTFWPMTTRARF